ncbi:MAG TPA: serine hydrolase domain-containing protein [Terriglobales bacterium]|jgi:CubicO group peptidase (beta-lactamase class C family)
MIHSFRRAFPNLTVILIVSMVASAQVPASQIDALFSKFTNPREPGCAVLVIKDGKTVFRRGYGVTDLRSLHAIGPETNFRLASLTKQFTATAIMLLVRDGKLRYHDHLSNVFPDFPTYGKAITIRHLLNHTSGLIDYEDIMEKQSAGVPDETIPQIKDAGVLELLKHQTGTKFPPGTRWDYSNSGYVVLALVVEKKSSMSFGDFLRQRIFKPLEMNGTIAYEKGKNEVGNRAYGHTVNANVWRETDQSSTSATLGDGGIYTSLDDLGKWDRALTGYTLLTAKEMAAALTPPASGSGGPLQKRDGSLAPLYGFGWFLDPYRGHRRYSHYGETVGFRTAVQRFPDDALTVIVLANRAEVDAPALAERVADLYLGKP